MRNWRQKVDKPLLGLVVVFIALSLAYNFVLPIGEGPDEPEHFGYVRALHEGISPAEYAKQERAQPPLAYAVAALLIAPLDLPSDDAEILVPNDWHYFPVEPYIADNRNKFLHTPEEADWLLPFRLARLASTFFGVLAVIGTYYAGRELMRRQWALLAALLVALTPQFLQISAQVSNDSAAAGTVALGLWAILVIANRGFTVKRALVAGVVIGLAALTKTSALVLIPVAALVAWIGGGNRIRETWRSWVVLGGATALVGGWWYLRGWLLNGDPFGTAPHAEMAWSWAEPQTFAEILGRLPWTISGYLVDFGWGSIRPHPWFYNAVLLLVVLSLIGWVVLLRHGQGARKWLVPLTLFAMTFAALVWWMRGFNLIGGRLLFPAHVAIGLLVAGGLQIIPRFGRGLLAGVWGGLAVLMCGAVLFPAFYVTGGTGLPTHQMIDYPLPAPVQYGESVVLESVALNTDVVTADSAVIGQACWRVLAPTDPEVNLAFAFHLVDAAQNIIAGRDGHHGMGRYPSSAWQAGSTFCDQMTLTVAEDVPTAQILDLVVSVYDPVTVESLPRTQVDCAECGEPPAILGQVRTPALDTSPADVSQFAEPYMVGDLAHMFVAPQSEENTLSVRLLWEGVGRTPIPYTVFLHVTDANTGEMVAQVDAPPSYATWAWRSGEWIDETFTVPLPEDSPDSLVLYIGLYNPADVTRLPIYEADERLPNDAVAIEIATSSR